MNRILVIEDNPVTQMLVASLLGQSGHEVVEAADGREAMRLFSRSHFDLVITDIIMPEQEGLSTIRAIRKVDQKVPILAMSGDATALHEQGYLAMTLDFGANDTMRKPLDLDTLTTKVGNLLQAGASA
jgi:CheY-like chemotaxis protein